MYHVEPESQKNKILGSVQGVSITSEAHTTKKYSFLAMIITITAAAIKFLAERTTWTSPFPSKPRSAAETTTGRATGNPTPHNIDYTSPTSVVMQKSDPAFSIPNRYRCVPLEGGIFMARSYEPVVYVGYNGASRAQQNPSRNVNSNLAQLTNPACETDSEVSSVVDACPIHLGWLARPFCCSWA